MVRKLKTFKVVREDGSIAKVRFFNKEEFESWFRRFNSVSKKIQIKRFKE